MERDDGYSRGPGIHKIDGDAARFREIVKKAARKDLQKHMGNADLIGRKGDELVRIPVPQIDPPHFVHDWRQGGGVGQGEGEPGDVIGRGPQGDGDGEAGDQPGEHMMEELTIDELTALLKERIELPNLLPLGRGDLMEYYWKMKGVTPTKTIKLDRMRSYKRALAAEAALAGFQGRELDPVKAMGILRRKDVARFRAWEALPHPITEALVIYNRDCSGSRTAKEALMDRTMISWIDRLLDDVYGRNKVTRVYIVHEVLAKVVTQAQFFGLGSGGGTKVSSAYELDVQMALANPNKNVFVFHCTDGENYPGDNDETVGLAAELLTLPWVRMMGFVLSDEDRRHDEELYDLLWEKLAERARADVVCRFARAKMESQDQILGVILDLLGRKK